MSDGAAGPLPVFRFHVHFEQAAPDGGRAAPLCGGAFAECHGLEATMDAKAIKEGGSNYGPAQRPGQVSFATVVLRRGLTPAQDLWRWWELTTGRAQFAYRLSAMVNVYGVDGRAALAWRLDRALPVKFKAADLNARGTEVGVEELHLAHEGLTLVAPSHPQVEPGGAAGGFGLSVGVSAGVGVSASASFGVSL